MQVDFYRIGRTPPPRVLAMIARRVIEGGGRLLVVADATGAAAIDADLWTISPESFLPHGRATADDPGADQPVLIAEACEPPANGARHVALIDGVWREGALDFDRAFHLFGEDGVDAARAAWRGLSGKAGIERNFWSQGEDGRWQQAT